MQNWRIRKNTNNVKEIKINKLIKFNIMTTLSAEEYPDIGRILDAFHSKNLVYEKGFFDQLGINDIVYNISIGGPYIDHDDEVYASPTKIREYFKKYRDMGNSSKASIALVAINFLNHYANYTLNYINSGYGISVNGYTLTPNEKKEVWDFLRKEYNK